MLKLFKKINFFFKKKDGMTLVEVMIAFLMIAIISFTLFQGTRTAVNVMKINRAKTSAIAVANEKIEYLRSMIYGSIDVTSENPNWVSEHPELLDSQFEITYDISWVDSIENGYKQVKVSVKRDPMKVPVSVVTQLYPGGVIESIFEYPPAESLLIEYDNGSGSGREIKIAWLAPDTEAAIDRYKVYRNGIYIGDALFEYYIDRPGNNKKQTYYVIVLYADGTESIKSNDATADQK